jgi:hypothetical protein
MIYVVAGSFEDYLKQNLSPHEYEYIESADGRKNIKFCLMGHYWRSPLWSELYWLCRRDGWQEVNIN